MSIFGKRNNVITYTVNKATNRDMYITIQNGEVIVNAPWYFTQNKIQAVVEEKKNWILSKINEYQQQSSNMQSVKIFGKNYDLKVVYSNIDTPELNIEENYEIKIILPNKMVIKKVEKKEKNPIKGENVETSIDVDIEEVFYGLDKKISLRTVDGKMKVFTVSIPAGLRNGEKIRLLGQGKEGIDGGKNGDLFIKVNIKDNEKFKLKGNDLYTNLYLTPWEAALGTRTTVYSIDEGTVVYIPEGIETGEILKISGKGYKDGKGGRGDLIAKVNIMVPKKLNNEEKKLFEKLSTISSFNPRKI